MVFDSVKFHGTNKFPASKYSVIGNYSTQKAAPVLDDRIQQNLVWKHLGTAPWGFNQWNLTRRIQDGTSTFRIFAEYDSPRHKVFKWDYPWYYRSLSNSLICFLFVSQLTVLSTNSLTFNKIKDCLNV